MAESQGAVPEVPPVSLTKDESAPVPLTKQESAKIHLGEGTETAFQKYKALFYSLRILRELVPALTIGVSLVTFFTALFTAFLKDSYGMALMSPVQSFALDKMVAHFIFFMGVVFLMPVRGCSVYAGRCTLSAWSPSSSLRS